MPLPRLSTGLALIIASATALALLHGCQETPRPTEPELAVAAPRTLTVTGSGSGDGVVTSSPAGIKCTVTAGVAATTGCKAQFTNGVVVTLTAVPKSGHSFLKWFGACWTSGTCRTTMTADRSVQARFLKGPFVVKISSGTPGVGTGTVKSQAGLTPAINCTFTNGTPGGVCSAKYSAYTALTLTATPAPGFAFSGWGVPCGGTGTCGYGVVQSKTIPATFVSDNSTGASGPALEGRWEPAFPTPVVAIHMHLLPTGKVLLWGHSGESHLWDPASPGGGFTEVMTPFEVFCSGHTFLGDGRLFVAGGNTTGNFGLPQAALFEPASGTWNSSPTGMAQGRYYPTTTMLPNGDVLVVAGTDAAGANVTIPEIWNGGAWRRLTTANMGLPYYPAMFVAPNGMVFYAGYSSITRYLDVTGTGKWTTVGNRIVANRNYGSAVMYAPGKVLYAGGGNPPTASAEVINLNQASPAWRAVPSMTYGRRHMLATLLADGKVLVTHGTSGRDNDQAGAVHYAELWDPGTESWTIMARESSIRTYHSTAILLPDGRVLSSGSGEGGGVDYAQSQFNAQIFTPPYLFNPDGSLATRPTITSGPSTIGYGQPFDVETPEAATVARGNLIRLSSVTHAFNESQLIYPLTFTADDPAGTTLHAMAPASANLAPPGPYMLFLLDRKGVPSEAKMVTVGP